MPDVPTVEESGVPGYELGGWFGLLAPAKTPKPVVDRLSREVRKAVADPRSTSRMTDAGARRVRQHAGGDAGADASRHQEMGRGHQGDRRQNPAVISANEVSQERQHGPGHHRMAAACRRDLSDAGAAARRSANVYEVVPDGIDITTVSLTIQQLTDDNMEEAIKGMERAAKQLSNFDVDVIYQSGVPPVVARGRRASPTSCRSGWSRLPACRASPTWSSVIDAMHALKLRTVAMATPFRQFINDRLVKYLAAEQITVTHNKALGIKRNTEIRRLPIPVEYQTARARPSSRRRAKPDGIYIPCGGWGSMHNIEPLEQDLDTTVVTWMNAMIWAAMKRGKVAGPIQVSGSCWRRCGSGHCAGAAKLAKPEMQRHAAVYVSRFRIAAARRAECTVARAAPWISRSPPSRRRSAPRSRKSARVSTTSTGWPRTATAASPTTSTAPSPTTAGSASPSRRSTAARASASPRPRS